MSWDNSYGVREGGRVAGPAGVCLAPPVPLLTELRVLDVVQQSVNAADASALRDAQPGAGARLTAEWQRDSLKLFDHVQGQTPLELADRAVVDLSDASASSDAHRSDAHLLEQLPHQGRDRPDLARPLNQRLAHNSSPELNRVFQFQPESNRMLRF